MSLESQIAQMINSDEFTRLCNTVFTADYAGDFQVIDGTRGDEGNDGYVASERRVLAIYCPKKPVRKTDADYVAKALNDLGKAAKLRDGGGFKIEKWTFVTPSKLANEVIEKIRASAEAAGLQGNHIESTYLAVLLRKHPHVLAEFPELQAPQLEQKLVEIANILKSKGRPEKADAFIHGIAERPESEDEKVREDSPEMRRVLELRLAGISEDAKRELKIISYKAADAAVQLNAIIGVLDLFEPATDHLVDMVTFCERGIALAKTLKSSPAEAVLLAQKANFITQQFLYLDVEIWGAVQLEERLGIGPINQAERIAEVKKLYHLQEAYSRAFADALAVIKETKDPFAMSLILLHLGISAGMRGSHYRSLEAIDRADAWQRICRSALLHAKDLNNAMGDELGAANAVFNLANQIRFFGEEAEAKELVKSAAEVAAKYGDKLMLKKAGWLMKTLESGRIPNHVGGERYD